MSAPVPVSALSEEPCLPAALVHTLPQAWHGYVQSLQSVQAGLTVTMDKAVAAMHLQESLIKYMMSVSVQLAVWWPWAARWDKCLDQLAHYQGCSLGSVFPPALLLFWHQSHYPA